MRTLTELHTVFLAEGICLTTRPNESSNEIPVLLVDGTAHSRTSVTNRGPASAIVREWAARRERSSAERAFAALFLVERCSSWSRKPILSRTTIASP